MPQAMTHPEGDKFELFAQVWKQCRKTLCATTCGGDCSVCRPTPWVAERLFRLVESEPTKPLAELAPAIRRVLLESRYHTGGSDAMITGHNLPQIDRQVQLVVEALDAMRRYRQQLHPGAGAHPSQHHAG